MIKVSWSGAVGGVYFLFSASWLDVATLYLQGAYRCPGYIQHKLLG